MIKQTHLASTLVRYFRQFTLVLFLSYINIFQSSIAQEQTKPINTEQINFPAAVIDMKVVLSKSSAFTTLQKEIQNLEKNYKEEIQNEENLLKKEQEKLVAQKSVLSAEEFKEKEDTFKQKVNKIQGKVEKIRRELESTMAKGMQIIQQEAVKHMKEIAKKEGYLLVFDANTTVISADRINISNIVVDKLNKSLPKITVEKKKKKKLIKNIILKPKGPFSLKKLAGFTKDKIIGKSNIIINKISSIENAISGSITFIDNKKYFKKLNATNASACIISENVLKKYKFSKDLSFLVSKNPYLSYAKLLNIFYPDIKSSKKIKKKIF